MAARQPYFNVTAKTPAGVAQQHSPWHSPVPYLFGGLAAMLGLIAFALLILACSYWKLSGYLDSGEGSQGERDLEAGEGKGDGAKKGAPQVMEQKFLVIMAGDVKPTFLATPISSSRSSSFGEKGDKSCCCEKNDQKSEEEAAEIQGSSTVSHEATNQDH